MRFELTLQDNKKIIVTKEQADIITKGLLAKQEIFKIGLNVFKRTAVKGLFPIIEEVAENKELWLKSNEEWNAICRKMSNRSVEDKTVVEITNRIIPGLELNKIKMTDDQIKVMEFNIRQFFMDNPKYPRCPLRIWWPFIRDVIAPEDIIRDEGGKIINKKRLNPTISMAHWWEICIRNDNAIEEWLKFS